MLFLEIFEGLHLTTLYLQFMPRVIYLPSLGAETLLGMGYRTTCGRFTFLGFILHNGTLTTKGEIIDHESVLK